MKTLKELTREEFNGLKNLGFLYEFYPDAPEEYEEIKGVIRLKNTSEQRELISEIINGNTKAIEAFKAAAEQVIRRIIDSKKFNIWGCNFLPIEEVKMEIECKIPIIIKKESFD